MQTCNLRIHIKCIYHFFTFLIAQHDDIKIKTMLFGRVHFNKHLGIRHANRRYECRTLRNLYRFRIFTIVALLYIQSSVPEAWGVGKISLKFSLDSEIVSSEIPVIMSNLDPNWKGIFEHVILIGYDVVTPSYPIVVASTTFLKSVDFTSNSFRLANQCLARSMTV